MEINEFGIYKSFYSTKKWMKIRNKAYERDNGECQHCGELCYESGSYNVDHITPINRDSPDELKYGLDNLQTLCIPCHNRKSVHDQENFTKYKTDTINNLLNNIKL